MSIIGFYYAHTNGELIFKHEKPEMELGGFVKRVWPFDPEDRSGAYCILIEASVIGAKQERIAQLLERWQITDDDCITVAGPMHGMLIIQNGPRGSCSKWAAKWVDDDITVGYGATAFESMVCLVRLKSSGHLALNGL